MSRFLEVYESWQTLIDKIPWIGEQHNDKVNKPLIDKIVKDKQIRKWMLDQANAFFNKQVNSRKKTDPKHKLSSKPPAGYEFDPEMIRKFDIDDDWISYKYEINGMHFIISTDGEAIRRVHHIYWEYFPEYNDWYAICGSLYGPTNDDLKKMWNDNSATAAELQHAY